MPATPRPALLLLPLLLLHVLRAARAQVNPGKQEGDQVAARAVRCVSLGCAPARASELGPMSSPPPPGLPQLWEQCVMAPQACTYLGILMSCMQLGHCWVTQKASPVYHRHLSRHEWAGRVLGYGQSAAAGAPGSEWGPSPWGLIEPAQF